MVRAWMKRRSKRMLENPLTVALRRAERWTSRARRDGEASDGGAALCDLYQAARVSAGLIAARPLGLCAERHDHSGRAW